MNTILKLLACVVLLLCVGAFLWWVMAMLPVAPILQNIIWVLFALLVVLLAFGLFGYGPLRDRL